MTLAILAIQFRQLFQLIVGFDPFGNDAKAEAVSQRDYGADDFVTLFGLAHRTDE